MQPVVIDPDALRRLAADRGIDTARELATRTGISEWVIYKALRSGRIQPSHAIVIAETLGVTVGGPGGFTATEPASA
ncbi:MAG: helix-turn-helix domain-containing protein [Candidatus Rokuibacteriota bacterium]